MAKPTLGQLVEFDPANGSVSAYIEQVELLFEANEIWDAKKVPVFLSAIGDKTYTLLRNLLAPLLPKEKSFGVLVQALKDHFEPRSLVIAERFHFNCCDQLVGESMADFVVELRRLAIHCEFGGYLQEVLRDHFVCRLRSEVSQKLLTKANLTFKKAVEIAQSQETATESARKLHGPA